MLSYLYPMPIPSWVSDAIFYQILPDRFANGDPSNDPPNVQPWGSEPTLWGYQGGDLRGILQRFDYLLDLGVNALYLNPIFQSTAYHRYHVTDYYKIDPRLGEMADFRALLDRAHNNDMHVILDGVFNHTGRGFFAFSDVLENGGNSPYLDWYHINSFPLDAFSPGPSQSYQAWWGMKDLPKLNAGNPAVRQYLFDVARYWIEQGADGWRLDVPGEINDDSFWSEFRQAVKAANPEAYLVGEVWEVNPRWVGDGHFDGLLNYPLRDALLDMLEGRLTLSEFVQRLEFILVAYPPEHIPALYFPLSTHDTRRLFNKLGGDVTKIKLAFLVQFTLPGPPAIYYGDEIGLPGEKDPFNRAAFPWEQETWNNELRAYVQTLIAARKRLPALRRGDFRRVAFNPEQGYYAFARLLPEEQILVVMNASDKNVEVSVPVKELGWADGRVVRDALSGPEYVVVEGVIKLGVAKQSGMMIYPPHPA